MGFLSTSFDFILNIIFPTTCLSCGNGDAEVCETCLLDWPPCERETAEWIYALYDYRHPPLKKAIWLLKYKGRKNLGRIFASVLYGRILEELGELQIMENFVDPILVPIPLSKKRLRERGFNQTELICRELVKLDNHQHFSLMNNILIKPKDTKRQAHIVARNERIKNIVGAFTVENDTGIQNIIKNRNIILIDDVTTTGATLSEARKVLKKSGARKIIAFTIAH